MTARPAWTKRVAPYARPALLIALVFVLLVTAYLLTRDLKTFFSSARSTPFHRLRPSSFRIPPQQLTVDSIEAWMTFDYLDRVFALPPDYLKQSLQISDSRYPRLSILRLSRDTGKDATSTVIAVKEAVRAYHATTSTTP